MTAPVRSRRRAWLAPIGVIAAVATATATAHLSAVADDHPVLTPRTAAQLLTAIQTAPPVPVTGSVRSVVDLGLPALPDSMQGSTGAPLSVGTLAALATGTHTFDVWADGPERQRVGLHSQFGETEFIHNGRDLWTYDSSANAVTHRVVPDSPAGAAGSRDAMTVTPDGTTSPEQLAVAALAAIDPTTVVSVDSTARVAGHAAYRLVLTPRDSRTLVGSVRLSIDADTSVPLQVQVFARGHGDASIDVAFTTVGFDAISPSVFAFTAPAGSSLNAPARGTRLRHSADTSPTDTAPPVGDSAAPTVLGSGWTAVASAALPAGATAGTMSDLLDKLGTRVPGGRLVSTALVTVLLTDSGRLYVGSVPAAELQQVASSGHGL